MDVAPIVRVYWITIFLYALLRLFYLKFIRLLLEGKMFLFLFDDRCFYFKGNASLSELRPKSLVLKTHSHHTHPAMFFMFVSIRQHR